MNRRFIPGVVVLTALATIAASKGLVPRPHVPPAVRDGVIDAGEATEAVKTPEELARERRIIEEAFRYKGTSAVPSRHLVGADPQHLAQVCKLLSEADFIPDLRVRRFAGLDTDRFLIVGWHLSIEGLDVREDETLVRVEAGPLLRAPGEGVIGVMTRYGESYRIVGGRLEFVGGDPMPDDMTISMSFM